ncbi:MAG: Fe-S cluster assembly protein HesB [Candidatus Thorarchaeota archaeon]
MNKNQPSLRFPAVALFSLGKQLELARIMDHKAIVSFQTKIMDWWSRNARQLPWREDPSPYNVLVSEIMLQQTQVNRVVSKYLEFLQEFPTIEALASADTKHLLSVWSGLGYNRRAVWLREAAQSIIRMGGFPRTVEQLRKLKGIGPYTSRSILIFAFNEDLATVDTNIRRVFIASGFADESTSDSNLQDIADELLLRGNSRDWHNALMDYGSEVLTSTVTGIAPTSTQPQFLGSTRQIRGMIIRELTNTESLTLHEMKIKLKDNSIDNEQLREVLNQLIQDGLVKQVARNAYSIAT